MHSYLNIVKICPFILINPSYSKKKFLHLKYALGSQIPKIISWSHQKNPITLKSLNLFLSNITQIMTHWIHFQVSQDIYLWPQRSIRMLKSLKQYLFHLKYILHSQIICFTWIHLNRFHFMSTLFSWYAMISWILKNNQISKVKRFGSLGNFTFLK